MANAKRRSFFKKALLGIAGLSLFSFHTVRKPRKVKGDFAHIVFFWLKEPKNETARSAFLKELSTFIDNMDVIVASHIGTPADTNRPVIDSSYSYCLVATFKNKKEQDIYQEHPLHKKFIENANQLWEKVVVYDSLMVS